MAVLGRADGSSGDARREHVRARPRDATWRVARVSRALLVLRVPLPRAPRARRRRRHRGPTRRGVPPKARSDPLLEGALSTPRRASARLGRRLAPARAASSATGHPPSSDVDAVDPNLRALVLVVCLACSPSAPPRAPSPARSSSSSAAPLSATSPSPPNPPSSPPRPSARSSAPPPRAPRRARSRRRFAPPLADGLYLAAALAMATSLTHQQLTLGRALAGVAVGVSTSLSAVYISECAPARFGAASRPSRPRGHLGHPPQLYRQPGTSRRRRRVASHARVVRPSRRRRSWRWVDTSWNPRGGWRNAVERRTRDARSSRSDNPTRTRRRSSERPTRRRHPTWHLPIGGYFGVRNIVARRRRRWD